MAADERLPLLRDPEASGPPESAASPRPPPQPEVGRWPRVPSRVLWALGAFTAIFHAVRQEGWVALGVWLLTYVVGPPVIGFTGALLPAALINPDRGRAWSRRASLITFVLVILWLLLAELLLICKLNGLSNSWVTIFKSLYIPVPSGLAVALFVVFPGPFTPVMYFLLGWSCDTWALTRIAAQGILAWGGGRHLWKTVRQTGWDWSDQELLMHLIVVLLLSWWLLLLTSELARLNIQLLVCCWGEIFLNISSSRWPTVDQVIAALLLVITFVSRFTHITVAEANRRSFALYRESILRWTRTNPYQARLRRDSFANLLCTRLPREQTHIEHAVPLKDRLKVLVHERQKTIAGRESVFRVTVTRDVLLAQALELGSSTPLNELLAGDIQVTFDGEQGQDIGGLRRDWFEAIGRELMEEAGDPARKPVFVLRESDSTLVPRSLRSLPDKDDAWRKLFGAGRLLATAMFHSCACPVALGSHLWKSLVEKPIGPRDVDSADPDFFKYRVKPLLAPGGLARYEAQLKEAGEEGLFFMSAALDTIEGHEPEPLCEGGEKKRVTEANLLEYLTLFCEYHLCGGRRREMQVFLQGFWDVFDAKSLTAEGVDITAADLAILVAGEQNLDPRDWRRFALPSPGPPAGRVHSMFWKVLEELSEEDRARLLHFSTGSSRLPPGGWERLHPPWSLQVGGPTEHLPTAHTCINQLVVPPYTSMDILREKLETAIRNDQGFGFM
eukprot:TRINITY_DN4092_c0_g2_i1.p1 TRINITY_DN4092_c0_g2~~TRINITY_DN4092_c0_g2_i1.p1  ORF type:complete len:756 (+),score=190.18 TRINITY_DN4092_c0_g2_i1:84-2270(+)